jgi:hypothetical protein
MAERIGFEVDGNGKPLDYANLPASIPVPKLYSPSIIVHNEGGCITVSVSNGLGTRIVASVPTGNQAAYPEAVARGLAEANERVDAHVGRYLLVYPNATVVRTSA